MFHILREMGLSENITMLGECTLFYASVGQTQAFSFPSPFSSFRLLHETKCMVTITVAANIWNIVKIQTNGSDQWFCSRFINHNPHELALHFRDSIKLFVTNCRPCGNSFPCTPLLLDINVIFPNSLAHVHSLLDLHDIEWQNGPKIKGQVAGGDTFHWGPVQVKIFG